MNKQLITSLVALCIYSMGAAAQVVRITKANEEKAKEIVSKMTLVEKLRIIGGELTFSIEPKRHEKHDVSCGNMCGCFVEQSPGT